VAYEMKNTRIVSKRKIRFLKEALLSYRPERIYLFGSWSRDEEDELSDMDIVVIKKTQKSFFDRLRETARLVPPELEGADILVYTPEEFIEMEREGNAFVEMIMEKDIIIYDRQTEN
jgi:predicted nucleotidyltransferase